LKVTSIELTGYVKDEHDVLTGNTAQVYRYAIKQRKPIGVREVQRALKLSSPTLAAYHLDKLEEAGLLKQTPEGYVVDKLVLDNFVRFRQLLLPKYLFYFAVFATAVVFQMTLFRPSQVTREFLFSTSMLVLAAVYFGYETIMTVLKRRI
jgi:nitrate reductase gamma subunit